MSIIELRHFSSFVQKMISKVICVHFLLGWVNFRISMNHQIAIDFFAQNFFVYIRNGLALCNGNILRAFPGVALCVHQPIRGFKAVKIALLPLVKNFQLAREALKIVLLPEGYSATSMASRRLRTR